MRDINTLKTTNKILNEYGIKANKRFGQNFLIDDNILTGIIDVSDINKNELIIEIGPGLGNLTEYILDKVDYALLVEVDSNMINILNDRFKNNNNFELLNEDILKVQIDSVIQNIESKNGTTYDKVKVIANLPYYITTPILFKLLQDSNRVSEIVVMVQKEVALRMVANKNTKDYGILTLMVKYLSDAKIEIDVPKSSFIPAPNVESAVIRLVKNKKYEVKNEELLFDLIHKAFAQRRKKMSNSLTSTKFNNLSKEEIEKLFLKCNINLNARAEELDLKDYIKIINKMEE